jgi:uncharacterized protein HemY
MKRWLWLIATGLIVGVALASFVSRDPGYVLLQVGGYRLETSLVALFLAVVGLLILLRLVGQLVRIILGVVPGFGRWLGRRKEEQNLELIHSSLDDVLSENTAGLLGKAGKLEKSSWQSESRTKQLRHWLFVRQIRASQKPSQLNKIWSGVALSDKADEALRVEYVSRLYQLGATKDVDVVLLETAGASWYDALNGVLAVHQPNSAEQLAERLTNIAATDESGAASLALTLLKAHALAGDAGDNLLIDAHKKQASEHLITALGARRLRGGA